MGEKPFVPGMLNIMSMAASMGGDTVDFDDINVQDEDSGISTTISHTTMSNSRPSR